MILSLLSGIGLATFVLLTLYLFYKFYRFYTFYFISTPTAPLKSYKRPHGTTWALVTGSSGGIGYSTAHRLLSLGFGVIILAHELIPEAEASLRKDFPKGEIISFEFNCMTASVGEIVNLVQKIKDLGLKVTILVNNVGSITQPHPAMREFEEYDAQAGIDGTIDLNARFMTHLSHQLIPVLKANAAPRSLILNISSGAYIGIPYMAPYSATKAYILGLSVSNAREFRVRGVPVDVLAVVPGDVWSMNNRIGIAAGSPKAHEFAVMMVGRVDEALRRDMEFLVPFWKHSLGMEVLKWLPESVRMREVTKVVVKKMEGWAREYKTK